MTGARAAGLALGVLADHVLRDPQRWHPVAGFGRLAKAAERWLYRDHPLAGVAYTAVLVTPLAAMGVLGHRATASRPVAEALLTALATWTVLCGGSLRRVINEIAEPLAAGDFATARARWPQLYFREAGAIADHELPATLVLSAAEGVSDAELGPLFWGAVAGVPGLLCYRAVNTLDSKVGHLTPRYRRFGWAAARLDDLANLAPSRIGAALAVSGAAVVAGSPRRAVRIWLRQAGNDPSPNSGQLFAAFAGALDVRLDRPAELVKPGTATVAYGCGGSPGLDDTRRAVRLNAFVAAAASALAAAVVLGRKSRAD